MSGVNVTNATHVLKAPKDEIKLRWPARCRREKNDEDKDKGMGMMAHSLKGVRFLSRNMY